ncbi:MAG TPA: dipeptidase [Gemmatimonadales bacterium]|nr:dipeptidase [Gemmatimonadales bacterium]
MGNDSACDGSAHPPLAAADPVERAATHEATALAKLNDFLAIPSVSTKAEHRTDVARCAEWLAGELRRIGLTAECCATAGHPVVVAEWRGARGAATVLIYGHYDVQPPEPLEQWDSPPFVGTARNGRLYARGAADDKGQLWIHIQALAATLEARGALPVNVVMVVEGEEEVGSPNLPGFLAAQRERLTCDYVLISDTVMYAPGVPNILTSMRGLAYFEIAARSAPSDLHSGQYGGVAPNAPLGLAKVLASLVDSSGRVAIPGFYDDVREPSPERREGIRGLAFDEGRFAASVGLEGLAGESVYSPLERLWLRPTCEVNGMSGGYSGEGAKTVIPASAIAKVSFRLVPDQTPDRVDRLLRDHVAQVAPPGVRFEVRRLSHGLPWTQGASTRAVAAARRALATAFAHEAVLGGAGGSIPVVAELAKMFDADILLIGFGLPGENAHAPNEWIDLDNLRRGVRVMIRLYEELGMLGRG